MFYSFYFTHRFRIPFFSHIRTFFAPMFSTPLRTCFHFQLVFILLQSRAFTHTTFQTPLLFAEHLPKTSSHSLWTPKKTGRKALHTQREAVRVVGASLRVRDYPGHFRCTFFASQHTLGKGEEGVENRTKNFRRINLRRKKKDESCCNTTPWTEAFRGVT